MVGDLLAIFWKSLWTIFLDSLLVIPLWAKCCMWSFLIENTVLLLFRRSMSILTITVAKNIYKYEINSWYAVLHWIFYLQITACIILESRYKKISKNFLTCVVSYPFFFYFKGRAWTQPLTTTNCAVEFPTFGELTGASISRVKWISLTLGKLSL